MADNNNKRERMPLEEAGRKGGEATTENHDKEVYQLIGSKSGKARHDND
ncbi:hypothetical protein [Bacillus sp. FJAT-50079]|nr:hypothetical protein [Bacillus sp. FJAT-50079]MBS4208423.1 hypothetical protein [Bacillus sp. FJAT-50079]